MYVCTLRVMQQKTPTPASKNSKIRTHNHNQLLLHLQYESVKNESNL